MSVSKTIQTSVIRSVQRGTVTIGSGLASATATITAVDTARSSLGWLGYEVSGSGVGNHPRLLFNSSVEVAAQRSTGGGVLAHVLSFEVVEYR